MLFQVFIFCKHCYFQYLFFVKTQNYNSTIQSENSEIKNCNQSPRLKNKNIKVFLSIFAVKFTRKKCKKRRCCSIEPNSCEPIGTTSDENFRTIRRKLNVTNRSVMGEKMVFLIEVKVRGASVNATFVRTHEIYFRKLWVFA